jgi:tetrahydromethanopterin S-methyltransferase subunit F
MNDGLGSLPLAAASVRYRADFVEKICRRIAGSKLGSPSPTIDGIAVGMVCSLIPTAPPTAPLND